MYLTVFWNLLDLDCYELVNKKQVLKTTTVPPVERTTKSKPDHGYKQKVSYFS